MNPYEMVERLPEQFQMLSCPKFNPENYRGIVFGGMGGSGIVGDFMRLFLESLNPSVPVLSIRGYNLPTYVGEGWLLVCTSYSGNTEETISTLEDGLRRGLKPVCVSSGGELQRVAQREGLLHLKLPEGYPPRYALGFMLSSLLCLFDLDQEVDRLREHLKSHKEEIKDQAQSLSRSLFTYLPVVYGTPITEPVAFRWKTQINENSKTLCYNAFLPEMHHNEVVGLDNPAVRNLCGFVLLCDVEDHPRILRRVDITKEIFKDLGLVLEVFSGKGSNLLERLLYLTYLGDWLSLYLADLYKQDPLPVRVIDFIKKSL
ncbi:MAG: bifunctional phosphoglucose/phosphomannose isomerase [Acidobacteria bacterium]|jgi:glucose/mannose-6-phosphate isomerase|nr:MAG: bifunctional phosphoglucose/phosphomannose isomerase [Acidobacteriota bacterium]